MHLRSNNGQSKWGVGAHLFVGDYPPNERSMTKTRTSRMGGIPNDT